MTFVIIQRINPSSNSQGHNFIRNSSIDEDQNKGAFISADGFSSHLYLFYLERNLPDAPHVATYFNTKQNAPGQYIHHAIKVAPTAAERDKTWFNGILETNIGSAGDASSNLTLDSFSLGSFRKKGGTSKPRFFELYIFRGLPEDFPQEFNLLHTEYAAKRYPALNIQNPGL
ncbi:MAG: hypothetical protein RIF33_22910 [Cyclobacteriaceae bacterium]